MTDFPEFWSTYPHPENRGSKAKAESLFNHLSLFDRNAAVKAVGPYREYLDRERWNSPMMAQTWLSKKARNWETWIVADPGESGDQKFHDEELQAIRDRNERRSQKAHEQWKERYERITGKAV